MLLNGKPSCGPHSVGTRLSHFKTIGSDLQYYRMYVGRISKPSLLDRRERVGSIGDLEALIAIRRTPYRA
jgi:hypothetical protein